MTSVSAAGAGPINGQRAQPMDPRRAIDALSNAVTAELLRAERPGVRAGVALVAGNVIIIGLLARVVPSLGAALTRAAPSDGSG
jgi:hypothetical protein